MSFKLILLSGFTTSAMLVIFAIIALAAALISLVLMAVLRCIKPVDDFLRSCKKKSPVHYWWLLSGIFVAGMAAAVLTAILLT